MTTLLQMVQDITDEVGLEQPSTLFGSGSDDARRYLGSAQAAGTALMRAQAWMVLQKEHTFATVASQAAYALPSDFDRLVPNTVWNRGEREPLRGNVPAQEWQWRKGAITVSSVNDTIFRIKADAGARKMFLDPTPDGADTVAFDYVSNEWARSSGGAAQTRWQADTDTTILDEYLMQLGIRWLIKRSFGFAYFDERDEYEVEVDKAWGRDVAPPILNASLHGRASALVEPNVPDGDWG